MDYIVFCVKRTWRPGLASEQTREIRLPGSRQLHANASASGRRRRQLMEGLQRAEKPTQSTQKFLRRQPLMGEGVAVRGLRPLWRLRRQRHIGSSCDVLELLAPCHARLLARSGAAAFGRSGHWQRGLRPRWRLRRPPALALACDCLELGSRISRVCSLASPGGHVRFAQKASSPRGRLILRQAQNSN